MNFRDPQALQAFLLERIREKTELDKLDFKLDLNFTEQRDKLHLVRLINAMVNTYDLEFDDHGFLIYGMNREDGRVTQAVPAFRDLGTDKLENQIGQLLRGHVHPTPQFNVYGFEEPGVGPWGAIVIFPDQTPPFVFSKPGTWRKEDGKTEQLWRTGEWRVRRGGTVKEPEPEDYARMLQARVQAATGPLREELRQLQAQVHRLEGRVQTLQDDAVPHLEVQLCQEGVEVHSVSYVPPKTAGQRALAPHMEKIDQLRAGISLKERDTKAPLERFVDRSQTWVYRLRDWEPNLLGVHALLQSEERQQALAGVITFLDTWGLNIPADDQDFTQAWLGSHHRHGHVKGIYGPDAERAKNYQELLTLAEKLRPEVTALARVAPFQDFGFKVFNPSPQATGLLKLEVQTEVGAAVQLFRFAPGLGSYAHDRHAIFNQKMITWEVPLPAPADERDNLLPGESWETLPFGIRFDAPGEHELTVRVLGERLRGPQQFTIKLVAHAEP